MRTIYKYTPNVHSEVTLPIGAIFRHVGEQDGRIVLWFDIETNNQGVTRQIFIQGTGANIKDAGLSYKTEYFGSVLMQSGLVWHVFGGQENALTKTGELPCRT